MTTTTINFTNKTIYNMVMSNLKQTGTKFTFDIPAGVLTVDDDYQRHAMVKGSRIQKLVNKWNENLSGFLLVSPHPEEGLFYIIDGFHRYTGGLQIGRESFECIILTHLADLDPTERKKEEARIFVNQSVAVERVTAVQAHNANVLIGNKPDVLIAELREKYNIPKERITGFTAAKEIASKNVNYLDDIFRVITTTDWNLEATGLSDHVLGAMEFIYEFHPDKREDITNELIKYFEKIDPDQVLADARHNFPMRKHRRIVMALEIEHHLHQTIGLSRTYTGKKIGVKVMQENDKRIGA